MVSLVRAAVGVGGTYRPDQHMQTAAICIRSSHPWTVDRPLTPVSGKSYPSGISVEDKTRSKANCSVDAIVLNTRYQVETPVASSCRRILRYWGMNEAMVPMRRNLGRSDNCNYRIRRCYFSGDVHVDNERAHFGNMPFGVLRLVHDRPSTSENQKRKGLTTAYSTRVWVIHSYSSLFISCSSICPYIPPHDTGLVCSKSRSGAPGTVSHLVIRVADQSFETMHVMPEFWKRI